MTRSAVALVRLIPAPRSGTPDAQLLGAFIATRAEEAFAELVRRHGPMVLATCRRVLGNAHDAEDAFQAVFLVLARKANAIRGANLAGWLYAVAVRTARGVRVMRDRRRSLRSQGTGVGGQTEPSLPADGLPPDSRLLSTELAEVIDEELARLPDHYREAVVLCELRGLSRKDAAAELGVPEGTLSSRLAAARRKLAERLAARGMAVPATLAAALVPATVSAGLVTSAVAAVRGAAGPVASAAAGVVVKAMLFDQLKAVVLAAGVLLTVACGGWAMTGTPGGDDPAAAQAPRAVVDPTAGLVQQLGAPEFADREAAEKQLRKLGLAAEGALRAGLKSESAEIRDRAAKLLAAIRSDARTALAKGFDPAAADEPDHPVWKRFRTIAGNDAAARKLFAEIIADPRRLKLLDDADRDPSKAGDLYASELKRFHDAFDLHMKLMWSSPPIPPAPQYPEAVAIMYLGTYPSSAGKAKEGWRWEGYLFIDSWSAVVKSPVGPAVKRIFATWLPVRDYHDARERGLAIAAEYRVKEVLPFARRVLADEKDEPQQRAQAALLLGILGNPDDLALLRRVAESKPAGKPFTHFNVILSGKANLDALWGAQRFGLKPIPEELKNAAAKADIRTCDRTLADCCWAAAVRLAGGKPEDMGFLWPRTALKEKVDDYWFAFVNIHGFPTEEARAAAHAKAREFLDKQKPEPKKDEPKPDPAVVKLVEQLAAPEFADREAAAKQLRELGAKAETALRAGLKSENPEIRERSATVLAEIRKDALDRLAKEFDPAKEQQPDHPVWRRFKAVAGDSRASRDLFAGIIKNPNWLRRLDAAETKPEAAAQQYRAALVEVGKTFRFNMKVTFEIPVWPCDRGEEVAYLLLLGSHPNTSSARPAGQDPEFPDFVAGESRIHFGHGLGRGLQGKMLEAGGKFRPDTITATPGTDRVFARLFAAWLDRREPASDVMPSCLWLAAGRGAKEVLPLARIIAAEKFPNDRIPPPELYAAALAVVARFGTREDLPLFERHFKNEMVATTFEFSAPNPAGGTTTRKGTMQVRDAAAGFALVLHGEDPAKYGFPMAGWKWAMPSPRWYPEPFDWRDLGFPNGDDKARSAAHAKVKEFLGKQPKPEPKKEEPRPDPMAVKLVEKLAAPEFADREAAEKALDELGEPALAALRAAAANAESAEVRKRAADLVRRIDRRIEVPVNLTLAGHTAHVNGVAFFPGSDKILTVGDMRYRIWDAKTGTELSHGEQGSNGYDGGGPAAVSPDGKRIAVRYFVADPVNHKFLFGLEGHTAPRTRITYANDGTRILTASEDGTVRLWRPDFEKELLKIDAHMGKKLPPSPFSGGNVPPDAKPAERFENRGARDAVFSPDGKRIVSGGDDGTVRIWNADTGKELRCMALDKVIVTSVAFLTPSKVISGGSDNLLRVWDVDTGKELKQFNGHTGWIRALAVSSDGARVVSASDDGTARVWDATTGEELRCFRGHTGQVYAVAIAPDGRTAVTGGADRTARVWSLPALGK